MKLWKTAALGLVLLASSAMAQQGPGGDAGGNPGGGPGAGPGGFDPAAIRTFIDQYQRNQLGATDDEWKVLGPKIQKVNNARMIAGIGSGGLMMGRGGAGAGGQGGGVDRQAMLAGIMGTDAETLAKNPLIAARKDLDATLANKDATPAQIQEKLKSFRDAREKAREELKNAQDDLRSVLTARQEALLVNNGTLE